MLHSPTLKEFRPRNSIRVKIDNPSQYPSIKCASNCCKQCALVQSEIHHCKVCMPNLDPPICMQILKIISKHDAHIQNILAVHMNSIFLKNQNIFHPSFPILL